MKTLLKVGLHRYIAERGVEFIVLKYPITWFVTNRIMLALFKAILSRGIRSVERNRNEGKAKS